VETMLKVCPCCSEQELTIKERNRGRERFFIV